MGCGDKLSDTLAGAKPYGMPGGPPTTPPCMPLKLARYKPPPPPTMSPPNIGRPPPSQAPIGCTAATLSDAWRLCGYGEGDSPLKDGRSEPVALGEAVYCE